MNLSETLLIDICHKSLENAKSLLVDAEILGNQNRLARSYTLYQMATEEAGKAIYCFLIIFEEKLEDPTTVSKFWGLFRSHQFKTGKSSSLNFLLTKLFFKGNFQGALDFLQESIDERDRLQEIDDLKNNSLYVGISDDKVHTPEEIITPHLVKDIEFKAKTRVGIISSFVSMAIVHLASIREHQKSNPNYELDFEEEAKQFW